VAGARLVILGHVYDLAQPALDMLEEAKSGLSSLPSAVDEQRVRLVHNRIGCDEMPVLSFGLREELPGTGVEGVLRDEMSEETAAVNEDVRHRSSAYTSARCLYFSVETVVKAEWNLPASPQYRPWLARPLIIGDWRLAIGDYTDCRLPIGDWARDLQSSLASRQPKMTLQPHDRSLSLARAIADPGADPWGNVYLVNIRDSRQAWVISAGPDGILQTPFTPGTASPAGDDRIAPIR